MGNKSKGRPKFDNRLQKEFDNRLLGLESSTFTGFIRAEALLNLLVEKEIITREEHSVESIKIYEESKKQMLDGILSSAEPSIDLTLLETEETEDETIPDKIEVSE